MNDLTIVDGNPPVSEKFLEMFERQNEIYGVYPRQTTCDGRFVSKDNAHAAKERGIKNVFFSK